MEDYIKELNKQQQDAVLYNDGPSLVIAGAGSGKTRVLTYKIVHLLNSGFDAHRILALTFTNKAAKEMTKRISELVGFTTASQLWMGTFHSIFLRLLRYNANKIGFKSDFTIYDTSDSKSLLKMIVKDMGLDDKIYKPSTLQSHISNVKNSLISPSDYEIDADYKKYDEKCKRPMTAAIYKAYWNRCSISNAMDFDDILFYTNILLRDNKDILERYQEYFQYILVDEYQDTNFAQHLIVSQLSKKNNKICVVGDDAQSIYSFRGANIQNILNLTKYFPTLRTFKLEQNYRSTQNIINAANSLIEKNKEQIHKTIFSENQKGNKISVIQSYSGFEESYIVANKIIELKMRQSDSYDDFAVLYRTNAQSRQLEEALRKRNIPYRIYGGLSFYQRKEIKDAISYFRLTINPDDDEALKRIINYPSRGIGDTTIAKIQKVANSNNCSMWQVISHSSDYELIINSGTANKLGQFKSLMQSFIDLNHNNANAFDIAERVIRDTKLFSILLTDNTPENISKQENIQELLTGVKEFINNKEEEGGTDLSLSHFLSEVSLATDQDSEDETMDGARVTLMTVHAAKGLEFKNVIIVGVEEELFPSSMSSDTQKGLEEERRLMYVAITRAKSNCIITFAQSRFLNGQTKYCSPSRFLKDIDPSFLSMDQTSSKMGDTDMRQANTIFIKDRLYTSKNDKFGDRDKGKSDSSSISRPTPSNLKPLKASVANSASAASSDGSETQKASGLKVNMRISHSRFGLGTIEAIDDINSDPKITVNFDNVGKKNLLLKFAKFNIIE